MISQPLPQCIQPPQLMPRHTHHTATTRSQPRRSSRLRPNHPSHTRLRVAGGCGGAGGGWDLWRLLVLLDDSVGCCVEHGVDVHRIHISSSSSDGGCGCWDGSI
jgi:hypothetical protein